MTKECFLRALQRHRERVIYAFGWAVVLLSPFLMMYFRSRNSSDPLPWGFYGAVWATMGVFLVFFLFHNRFVAPLFFRPRKGRYFIFAFLLVLLLGVFQYLTFPLFGPPPPEKRSRHEVIVRDKEGKTVRGVEVRVLRFAKPGIVERVDLASLFILTLMFGVNLGVKIYFRSEDTSRELMLLQQEKLSNQLKYLKAQINPHFIYNTLSSIRFLLEMDKVQEAGEMVFYFSKLLRQTLSRSVEFIPLGEELDTLKCYVELQHLRYPDTFDYSCEVDEALRDNTLPKLLLQPVVENSIFHGVGRHKIHIRLRGWLEGDTLILRVEDDGVGISKDKIDQVMNKDLQINRVGLKNVQERIRLNYGPGYGLTVTGGPAGGTVVTFRLPRTR